MSRLLAIFGCLFMIYSCKPTDTNPLTNILHSEHEIFETILDDLEKYELQVIYTQIDRDLDNHPIFTTYKYRVDKNQYFYPASTVKMPVAFLAMEKVNRLNINGFDIFCKMQTDSAFEGQSRVLHDSTSADLNPSLAHYIKKVFLVSDNDAFNRLYEFVGQQTIHELLTAKGFSDQRLVHRLSIPLSTEQNQHTNPIVFYKDDTLVYHQGPAFNVQRYTPSSSIKKGEGHMIGDSLVSKPMDFSNKNYISLDDLHGVLQAVIFPEAQFEEHRFQLTEVDYKLLYQFMSQLPEESYYPRYSLSDYYDSYVKFFLYGDSYEPIPKHIRIFNKVGLAYGYMIDVAYVVDFENHVEFFLSAVIHVNENQIYDDGVYEYDSLGLPFLAQLGRSVYQYELERPKKQLPDLSEFAVEYD